MIEQLDDCNRQIPYAIGQFTVNEFCHELALRSMSEETKQNLSGGAKFGISLGSGIIAGFAAAILSQVRHSVQSFAESSLWISNPGGAPNATQGKRNSSQEPNSHFACISISTHRP